jgi:purine-binding chemotaxis protein CheW
MAENDKRQETLVDEKQALGIYLESLLRDVPEAGEGLPVAEAPVAPPPAPVVEAPTVAPAPEPVIETPVTAPVEAPAAEPLITPPPPPVAEVQPAPAVETPAEPSPWEGIPEWGEEPFQALLFRLSGLTMAIPLIELDGILEWPDTLTPLPNRSPWYLGLLDNRGKTVPVIELAQLVIPERIRAKSAQGAQQNRVILIGDGRWGIACDSVSEVITLNPDEVRWRGSRTRRKWLAGTVINHMCALMDAQGLVHLLSTGTEEPAV